MGVGLIRFSTAGAHTKSRIAAIRDGYGSIAKLDIEPLSDGEFTFSGRAGRIPGAVHLPWFDALTGGDVVPTTQPRWQAELTDPDVERMKSASELRGWLEDAGVTPEEQVITYCQTLWRGAHLYFVLRLMGYEDVRGYDGSWAEWSVTGLPIETGEPR